MSINGMKYYYQRKFIKSMVLGISIIVISMFLFQITLSNAFARELKLSHVLTAEHSWHTCSTGFAKEVKEKTGGRVNITIFPNGQLGNEKDEIEGLQLGTIQMGVIGSGSFQDVESTLGITELPFAFLDSFHAYRAFDGELGNKLAENLEKKGITVLAWWDLGFRSIGNNRKPIETVEDLSGLKMRVTPIKMRLDAFRALGALPVPMSWSELYSALQQGVVEGWEGPISIMYTNHFYEVQKFLSITNHIYNPSILVISNREWDKISSSDKKIMKEAAFKWRDKQRKIELWAEIDAIEKLKQKGMLVNDVDTGPFVEKVRPVREKYTPIFGKDLIKLIDTYRDR